MTRKSKLFVVPKLVPARGRTPLHDKQLNIKVTTVQKAELWREARRLKLPLSHYLRLITFHEMPRISQGRRKKKA